MIMIVIVVIVTAVNLNSFGLLTPHFGNKGPSLRFQSISVGERSNVKGMVPPGVSFRKGASIEKLSVVREGAEVSYLKSLCGDFEIALVSV